MTGSFPLAAAACAIVVSLLKPTLAAPIINARGVAVAARSSDEPANLVHWYYYRR
jgi:hypothetical protein